MMTLSVEYFCWFLSLVMASCGFVAVTVAYCCQNRSKMWSNVKNSEITDIFCSVYKFWQFHIWVYNLITRIVVDYRSSVQSWNLRFFCGDLRVFDFFGNTHREAHTCTVVFKIRESEQSEAVKRTENSLHLYFLRYLSVDFSPTHACVLILWYRWWQFISCAYLGNFDSY